MNFNLSTDRLLVICSYILMGCTFCGQVFISICMVRQSLEFRSMMKSREEAEEKETKETDEDQAEEDFYLHVPLALLMTMWGMALITIGIHLISIVLTILGFRRRVRSMAYCYFIFLTFQFMMWFDITTNGVFLKIPTFFWGGSLTLITSILSFFFWYWRAMRTFIPLFPDPQRPRFPFM
ncbi:unnamed protein product, partial [Mesorhabditis belari]|uniref:Uncharacterized protein n=1 Tax=Mesorhabditis belari TaxID=2138241 RepID=A0AAF3J519_9BILA